MCSWNVHAWTYGNRLQCPTTYSDCQSSSPFNSLSQPGANADSTEAFRQHAHEAQAFCQRSTPKSTIQCQANEINLSPSESWEHIVLLTGL